MKLNTILLSNIIFKQPFYFSVSVLTSYASDQRSFFVFFFNIIFTWGASKNVNVWTPNQTN